MVDLLETFGYLLLFVLVSSMSATVDIGSMKEQVQNKRAIVTGIVCQFVLLPLIGFLVVHTMQLEHTVGITLLVVTSSPGGSYSNLWCSLFNADLALSVTMTAFSTILSILMLPLNLLVYTRYSYDKDVIHSLDWTALFLSLAIVISAITTGLFLSYRKQSFEFSRRANQIGNLAGMCLILFSATVSNSGGADSKIWSRNWTFYLGVSLPCILGLLFANIIATICKLERPERVTVAIECCYQNVGIASSLALTMFDGDDLNDAMGVPFFYGLVEAIFVGIYCIWAWKVDWTKASADASFWDVLATSYEVLVAEEKELREIEISCSASEQPDESSESGEVLTHYFNASSFSEMNLQNGVNGEVI